MSHITRDKLRGLLPVSLALIGLLFTLKALTAHSAACHSPPPPPSAPQERLWAAAGLNEAWYIVNGYTDAPPPSASPPSGPSDSAATFHGSARPEELPRALARSITTDTPRLILDPQTVLLAAYADQPTLVSATVSISNSGSGTLSWTAQLAPGGSFTPTLVPTSGLQGEALTLLVDSALVSPGPGTLDLTYTRRITVTATPSHTLDNPQLLTVCLHIVDGYPTHLPLVAKMGKSPGALTEVRALWVTRYDWTSAYGPEGPADIDRIVANVAGAGFNIIFFQVRSYGEAFYTPGLEPWSARLNGDGTLGQDPGWDPLARLIEQAHARGIETHAYVNVYPAWLGTAEPLEDTTPPHVYWTWSDAYNDDWRQWHQTEGPMALNDGYLWASPGVDGVQDHLVAIVSDIVARYEVDGVHLDRARYASSPYSYDPLSNAAAGDAKTPDRDQWQRDRVNDLVGQIYTAIREIRPGTRLSAAVWFCYHADGCGYDLSSGYADYYQDSLGWLSTGTIDAIAPMLYGWSGFEDLEIWRDVMLQFQSAHAGRHVYPGISGDFDDFAQIAARIQAAREAGTAGHAIFSYGALDRHGYWDDLAAGPYAQPATPGLMRDR